MSPTPTPTPIPTRTSVDSPLCAGVLEGGIEKVEMMVPIDIDVGDAETDNVLVFGPDAVDVVD